MLCTIFSCCSVDLLRDSINSTSSASHCPSPGAARRLKSCRDIAHFCRPQSAAPWCGGLPHPPSPSAALRWRGGAARKQAAWCWRESMAPAPPPRRMLPLAWPPAARNSFPTSPRKPARTVTKAASPAMSETSVEGRGKYGCEREASAVLGRVKLAGRYLGENRNSPTTLPARTRLLLFSLSWGF